MSRITDGYKFYQKLNYNCSKEEKNGTGPGSCSGNQNNNSDINTLKVKTSPNFKSIISKTKFTNEHGNYNLKTEAKRTAYNKYTGEIVEYNDNSFINLKDVDIGAAESLNLHIQQMQNLGVDISASRIEFDEVSINDFDTETPSALMFFSFDDLKIHIPRFMLDIKHIDKIYKNMSETRNIDGHDMTWSAAGIVSKSPQEILGAIFDHEIGHQLLVNHHIRWADKVSSAKVNVPIRWKQVLENARSDGYNAPTPTFCQNYQEAFAESFSLLLNGRSDLVHPKIQDYVDEVVYYQLNGQNQKDSTSSGYSEPDNKLLEKFRSINWRVR